MRYIAHRGLMNGPDKQLENNPQQVETALLKGYDAEIDLWLVDEQLYLGHDNPQYQISQLWLDKRGLWIHAKNLAALRWLSSQAFKYDYFWHENDKFTMTSNEYIWTNIGQELSDRSIMVMPEVDDPTLSNTLKVECYGICSDYVDSIMKMRSV